MNSLLFTYLADRLSDLRSEDRRLDAVLDLGQLENALRLPESVDLYGVATVYKARLIRRQADTGNDDVLNDLLLLLDEVMTLSIAP
jgi:hypothetical protein